MKRPRRTKLRGSVQQNTPVRLRADQPSRLGRLYRIGIAGGVIAVLLIIGAIAWEVGWPQRQARHLADGFLNLTGDAHFAVRDIVVEGRQQTSRESVAAALGTTADAPILAFDPAAAVERLQRLPWVASAVVERHLPDTIMVKLVERVPMARWQHDGHIGVIDMEGRELPDARPDAFTGLPMVVGADAPAAAKELLDDLRGAPAVNAAMSAAVRVGSRRWDIHLLHNVTAKLPENGMAAALTRLQDLIAQQKILDRDVASIDLRISDRLTIESATPAATPRPARKL